LLAALGAWVPVAVLNAFVGFQNNLIYKQVGCLRLELHAAVHMACGLSLELHKDELQPVHCMTSQCSCKKSPRLLARLHTLMQHQYCSLHNVSGLLLNYCHVSIVDQSADILLNYQLPPSQRLPWVSVSPEPQKASISPLTNQQGLINALLCCCCPADDLLSVPQ